MAKYRQGYQSKIFPARFPGECGSPECDEIVVPGDPLVFCYPAPLPLHHKCAKGFREMKARALAVEADEKARAQYAAKVEREREKDEKRVAVNGVRTHHIYTTPFPLRGQRGTCRICPEVIAHAEPVVVAKGIGQMHLACRDTLEATVLAVHAAADWNAFETGGEEGEEAFFAPR